MNINNLLKERKIQLGDLREGKIYHGELIIKRNDENYLNMATARRENGEIWVTKYHVAVRGKNIGDITIETGQEYSPEDKEYKKLNKMLEKIE